MKKFNDFLLEKEFALYEIGEGSRPFAWRRKGNTKVDSWMGTMSMDKDPASTSSWPQLAPLMFEFKSDKATYYARISGGYQRNITINFGRKPGAPKPADYNIIIVVSFDIDGRDDTPLTNFGEQFRVLTTVTDILDTTVKEINEIKWVDLKEIRIMPKMEDSEEGVPITQSKRGRLYLEYIKKQGHRLPGDWTAEIDKEMFILKKGKWSSPTNPDKYFQI